MDGKKTPIKITQEIDKSKLTSEINSNLRGTYTPVYMCTNKITFSDMVSTVSAIVTLAAAAITFSIIAFTTAALKSSVEKALATASITLLGASFLDGYVMYDQYRTSVQVSTSVGSQYMYRTQNYKFGGILAGKKLSNTTISGGPGEWYFASKPY